MVGGLRSAASRRQGASRCRGGALRVGPSAACRQRRCWCRECTAARSVHPDKGLGPVDTSIRSTDVASLVKKVGGEGLYGSNPTVTLRELIQNARDAVVARRLLLDRGEEWGRIIVRLVRDGDEECLEVEDNGLGMSEELLSGPLLDFGTSYWQSFLSASEHPGLFDRGFQPQGTYGIGFFSVFMLGDRVKVVTRRPMDGVHQTRVLEFVKGLDARPMIRSAADEEWLNEPGPSCACGSVRRRTTASSHHANARVNTWIRSKQSDRNPGNSATYAYGCVLASTWTLLWGPGRIWRPCCRRRTGRRSRERIFSADCCFTARTAERSLQPGSLIVWRAISVNSEIPAGR